MNKRILSFVAGVALVVGFSACEKEVEEGGLKNSPGHDQYEALFNSDCVNPLENFMGKDTYKSWGNQDQSSGTKTVGIGITLWKQGNQTELRFAEDAVGFFALGYHSGNYYNCFVFDAECIVAAATTFPVVYKFDGKVYSTMKWDYDSGIEGCPYDDVDKKELEDFVTFVIGEDLNPNCYTEASWAIYQSALAYAQIVLAGCFSEAEVAAALTELEDAYDNLVWKIVADAFFINLNNLKNQVSLTVKEAYVYPFFPEMTDEQIENAHGTGQQQRTLLVLTLVNPCLYGENGTVFTQLAKGSQGDSGTTGVNVFEDKNVKVTVNHEARSGTQVFSCTKESFVYYSGTPVVVVK